MDFFRVACWQPQTKLMAVVPTKREIHRGHFTAGQAGLAFGKLRFLSLKEGAAAEVRPWKVKTTNDIWQKNYFFICLKSMVVGYRINMMYFGSPLVALALGAPPWRAWQARWVSSKGHPKKGYYQLLCPHQIHLSVIHPCPKILKVPVEDTHLYIYIYYAYNI